MSIYLYEKSLVDSLVEITGDSNIRVISPETSLSFMAELSRDKVNYPAVVLSRGPVTIDDYINQVVAQKGQSARIDENSLVVKAQLVPVRVEWNVDVFAVDRFTCDEIIRELIFYFITHPRFQVKVPYSLNIDQNFDIFVGNEISDNTDLIEFDNKGELYRETFTIYTENAHLFSSHRQYQTSFSGAEVCTNTVNEGEYQYGRN